MAVYSTYNYGTKLYDYWDDGKPQPTHAVAPPKSLSLGGSSIGSTVEASAWRVPVDARKVGQGELPKGRIASMGDISSSSLPRVALCVGVAYLAWRYLK